MRINEKGQVMTIVGEEFDYNRDGILDPQTEICSPIGRVYDGLQAEVKSGLDGKVVITEPYTDSFGSWVTVVAPIYSSAGKPEAIIGVDYPQSLYETGAQKIRVVILCMSFAILSLIFYVVWFISSLKSKTQNAVDDIARMAKNLREGKLDENLDKSNAAKEFYLVYDEINLVVEAVRVPLNDIIKVMQSLAKRQLNIKMSDRYQGKFLELAHNTNSAIEDLKKILTQVNEASQEVFAGCRSVSQSSDTLSQDAIAQASALEEISSSLNEIKGQAQKK